MDAQPFAQHFGRPSHQMITPRGTGRPSRMRQQIEPAKLSYVCMHLYEDSPSKDFELRVESLGASCIMYGAPKQVYAVIELSPLTLVALMDDPEVETDELEEPPSAK